VNTADLRRVGDVYGNAFGARRLTQVWFGKGAPVGEYQPEDLFEEIRPGDHVVVDGESGEIRVGVESRQR
jgi:hypothetical protein